MKDGILGFIFSAWGWLSIAAIAAGLEILVPGAYLMWLALAAFGTAVSTAFLNLSLDGQLGAFAIWIAVSLFAARRLKLDRTGRSDVPLLNQRGARQLGASATVTEAISGGRGRVKLGDSEWLAEGPDAPVGARVRIVGSDGAILKVAAGTDGEAGG
jgi:membrane protein implicated in regulation of membrane protease activity